MRVLCRRKESSRSLSHLLMSFLFLLRTANAVCHFTNKRICYVMLRMVMCVCVHVLCVNQGDGETAKPPAKWRCPLANDTTE